MNYKKLVSPIVFALLTVVNLSTSCASFSQPADSQQNFKVQVVEKTAVSNETELEQNKRTWTESNIENYKITLESAIADALYTTLSPIEIEVRAGKAVSIRHIEKDEKSFSIEEAKNNYGLMRYEQLKIDTVEGMFDLIKRAEEGKTADGFKTILLEVEYNSKYGYPTKIKYDVAATDSYISLLVKKFEIIE